MSEEEDQIEQVKLATPYRRRHGLSIGDKVPLESQKQDNLA